MDSKEFLKNYMANNNKDEKWLADKIQHKKDKVGGLLSDEGATHLIAGELGWQIDQTQEAYFVDGRYLTALGDENLIGWIVENPTNGKRQGRIDTVITKVISVGDAQPGKSQYTSASTGVKVTDGKVQTWINFQDKPQFVSKKNNIIPGNLLSTEVQMIRSNLIGRTIEIRNVDIWESNNGTLQLSTNNFSKLIVLKDIKEKGEGQPSPTTISGYGNGVFPTQTELDKTPSVNVGTICSNTDDVHTTIYNFVFMNNGVTIDNICDMFPDYDREQINDVVEDLINSGEVYVDNGTIRVL